jgi:threonine dehydrogenase-like Zn-dependent dehydrogenase
VRAIRFYASVPRFLLAGRLGKRYPIGQLPLKLETLPEPEPPPGWRRVRVRLCGICGSDLGLLYGKNSPRLTPFFSFPAVLGHEILGEVEGARVIVNPLLACRERGLERCAACQRGEDGLCHNIAEGSLAPSGSLGFCRDLPGGWSEALLAHPERLHPVPDGVPDERAVLAEPLAVALRGLALAFDGWPAKILIIGMGTIGLLAVRALRLQGYSGEIHAAARYASQAEAARAMGADHIHASTEEAAKAVGARSYRAIIGPPGWRGGFEAVIDAAGSASSLEQASWATTEGGTLLLLGAPGSLSHDFSPYWFREVKFLGSYVYAESEFKQAVAMLSDAKGLEALVTHRYALDAWPEALETLRRRRAVKVAFDPSLS